MVSYDDIATKDDKKFKRACFSYIPKWRRPELGQECKERFQEVYAKEPCEIKKANLARRAVNFMMLKEAMEYGMTNWREWQELRRPENPIKQQHASSPYLKPRTSTYNGPSILEMAEKQRRESRG